MGIQDLKTKARDALRRKQYPLAIEIAQEYLALAPNDEETVSVFLQAAKKYRETRGKSMFGGALSKLSAGATRDPKKRIASCLRVLAKKPEDKATLMALGNAAMDAAAYQMGVVAFKQAAEVDPDDNEPWKRLGEALGRKGDIKEALDALSQAVRIEPRDQEAQKLRKNLAAEGALKISGYETAGSSRELIKDKQAAQELESESRIQLTPEHAADEITKVKGQIEEDPSNSRLYVRLHELQLQRGLDDDAVASLNKALELEPNNYDLGVRLGDLELRPLKSAASAARKAMAASPEDASRKAAYDSAMATLTEASIKEYSRRVSEHPLDLAERYRLGQWLLQAGRVDEALAEFQQTVRDPNIKVQSLQYQARCFESKNILNLAVKKLEEAAESFPTLTSPKAKEVNYDYADLLQRKGDNDEARKIFESIVEEDASYRDVLERLSALS